MPPRAPCIWPPPECQKMTTFKVSRITGLKVTRYLIFIWWATVKGAQALSSMRKLFIGWTVPSGHNRCSASTQFCSDGGQLLWWSEGASVGTPTWVQGWPCKSELGRRPHGNGHSSYASLGRCWAPTPPCPSSLTESLCPSRSSPKQHCRSALTHNWTRCQWRYTHTSIEQKRGVHTANALFNHTYHNSWPKFTIHKIGPSAYWL